LAVTASAAGAAALPPQRNESGPAPAYRLIALPSGRILAEARPAVLATEVAPGSLMKLAALIALYEQGAGDVRLACARRAVVDGRTLTCVHPDLHRPLTPADAVGYSCNTYFATLAPRLSRQALDSVLVRLGLTPTSPHSPVASAAVGLAGVRATPIQLLEAFLRVVGAAKVQMAMPEGARQAIRVGTELAARAGTAAALGAAGFSGLAKTGTAAMPGGGQMGLVTATVSTELPTHAIVVLAPGAAGRDAAAIAAELLRRHGAPRRAATVRVGIATRDGAYDIRTMDVEAYVSRVVAGEMGAQAEPAALEAMAVTARTFLEANRGRHGRAGFDVCDLTHCQVLGRASPPSDHASRATAGLVLVDRAAPAEVYYSASCGGHTEKPSAAWPGARDVPHLPAQPDPPCAGGPAWQAEMTEPDLRRVLQAAGLRGDRVDALAVSARYGSGRAARLSVRGLAPGDLDANAFRTAAGRVLGWQTVKSTMFDVRRSAAGYIVAGRGVGHGVGLCVIGAINRARAGAGRDAILSAYFPGLRVARIDGTTAELRITLPEAERDRLDETRRLAAAELDELSAWLGRPAPHTLEIVFHPTVEAYTRATGQPWWTAGAARATRIDLLPRGVLVQRGILQSTLRHEIAHVLSDEVLADRPLWVREGLAAHLAGETRRIAGEGRGGTASPRDCPSDEALRSAASAEAWRRAYDAAGACVARALAAGVPWFELR
jgi:stage II sporulation protein D